MPKPPPDAPAASDTPERRSPEQWAEQKRVPAWQLAATRARHTLDDAPGRTGWLENGTLTEADFDAALTTTMNGEIR